METIIFIFIGSLGLTAHWFKRWARKQCDRTFFDYMNIHKAHSFVSVFTMIAGVLVLSGDVITQESLSTAFLIGYSVDSAVNK